MWFMSPKKVLWLTRHSMLPEQEKVLKSVLGDKIQIEVNRTRFKTHQDVINIYRQERYSDFVLVAPDKIFVELAKKNIRPLRSVGRTGVNDATYRFSHFERVQNAQFSTRMVNPNMIHGNKNILWIDDAPSRTQKEAVQKLLGNNANIICLEPKKFSIENIASRANANDIRAIITNRPLWYLAKLQSLLKTTQIWMQDFVSASDWMDKVDWVNRYGEPLKLNGFLHVEKAIWQSEKLGP